MVRQRLRIGSSPLALLGRIVLVLFALALVWYGAMLVLLAFKVSPHTVNDLSGTGVRKCATAWPTWTFLEPCPTTSAAGRRTATARCCPSRYS